MNVLIARVRVVLPMLGALLILVGSFADVGWLALNSPANPVPSHGLHAYGCLATENRSW